MPAIDSDNHRGNMRFCHLQNSRSRGASLNSKAVSWSRKAMNIFCNNTPLDLSANFAAVMRWDGGETGWDSGLGMGGTDGSGLLGPCGGVLTDFKTASNPTWNSSLAALATYKSKFTSNRATNSRTE